MSKEMKVIHRDKNGNVIEDLSKVKVPLDIQERMFKLINPHIEWEEAK